jgi:hypothetical protein
MRQRPIDAACHFDSTNDPCQYRTLVKRSHELPPTARSRSPCAGVVPGAEQSQHTIANQNQGNEMFAAIHVKRHMRLSIQPAY